MAIYIVTYDLIGEPDCNSYKKLIELIKQGNDWARLGGSSYLVDSSLSPSDLRDKYMNVLDKNDKLYVGIVDAPAAWYGYSKDVTKWIKDKL
jgi:hypothetical protein